MFLFVLNWSLNVRNLFLELRKLVLRPETKWPLSNWILLVIMELNWLKKCKSLLTVPTWLITSYILFRQQKRDISVKVCLTTTPNTWWCNNLNFLYAYLKKKQERHRNFFCYPYNRFLFTFQLWFLFILVTQTVKITYSCNKTYNL